MKAAYKAAQIATAKVPVRTRTNHLGQLDSGLRTTAAFGNNFGIRTANTTHNAVNTARSTKNSLLTPKTLQRKKTAEKIPTPNPNARQTRNTKSASAGFMRVQHEDTTAEPENKQRMTASASRIQSAPLIAAGLAAVVLVAVGLVAVGLEKSSTPSPKSLTNCRPWDWSETPVAEGKFPTTSG
jgi:hypothetical protein